jgi:hypothetical protein
MSSPSPHDTEAWYRQFWPWFIFALPASVVVAGITTVFIAAKHADDLVADDYYKNGLAINRVLEKSDRAVALGLSATISLHGENVEVLLSGKNNYNLLLLDFFHPLEADRDFQIELTPRQHAVFAGYLSEPVTPNWHWRIEPASRGDWQLQGIISEENLANVPER